MSVALNVAKTEYLLTRLLIGDKIPAVGLGTWQSAPGEVAAAVKSALQQGYRHIDTALAYGNEKEVGEGIKASGVPREEIWVTTKVCCILSAKGLYNSGIALLIGCSWTTHGIIALRRESPPH